MEVSEGSFQSFIPLLLLPHRLPRPTSQHTTPPRHNPTHLRYTQYNTFSLRLLLVTSTRTHLNQNTHTHTHTHTVLWYPFHNINNKEYIKPCVYHLANIVTPSWTEGQLRLTLGKERIRRESTASPSYILLSTCKFFDTHSQKNNNR